MVASAENVLKSTENNSKSCEKPLNVRHDMVFLCGLTILVDHFKLYLYYELTQLLLICNSR